MMKNMQYNTYNLDHIDIVVSHKCNMNCQYCMDKFKGFDDKEIEISDIDNFLCKIRKTTNKNLEVILLGGEPTIIGSENLIVIANLIKYYGFSPIISTNGLNKSVILDILPYFDWIQITTHSDKETDYWRKINNKYHNINIKLSGDTSLTYNKLRHFLDTTNDFVRRSVSMYFTSNFKELCTDKSIWILLDRLSWKRNGSYLYAFFSGTRFKRCIKGETNIIDEPSVPKLYPNGNYNKTWINEDMDDYIKINK